MHPLDFLFGPLYKRLDRILNHLEILMSTTQDLNNAVNTVTQAVNDNTTAVNAAVTAIEQLRAQIAAGGVDPTAAISQLGTIATQLQASTTALNNAMTPLPPSTALSA
jgi:ABC-type transporter Mla subunit MlaD